MDKNIDEQTKHLFNRSYGDNLTDDQEDELLDQVDAQISEFGWNDTFASWNKYLLSECKTPESVINFANLFWWYGGQDHAIPDPHNFLGYFYYRINFQSDTYDSTDILDSLSRNILSKAGYREANLVHDPQYMPENDPKIIAAARKYETT
ncbi:MAG: hypothetical protein K6B14_08500 [Lachnospiraceae bacterium]|nr:hypothetical protein [Lachnospiraceae bacterium]